MATSTGIPVESKPEFYKDTTAGKKVIGDITAPVIPTSAQQTYTNQALDPTELLTTATMGAPTTVGQRAISKPTLGAAANAGTTGVSAPSAITAAGYTGYTAGAPASATGATATGLTRTVAGQTSHQS